MNASYFCFLVAALAAMTGMALGIHMGIAQDFTLAPAHAHLNLLGWVTMALYGLYHRGVVRQNMIPVRIQAGAGAVGACLMAGGLAAYLGFGNEAGFMAVVVGSVLSFLSMLMFLALVIADLRSSSRLAQPEAAQ